MNCESSKETIERIIEVKVGLQSVIVGQSELDNLIEALSEMRNLAADGRALINIGAA